MPNDSSQVAFNGISLRRWSKERSVGPLVYHEEDCRSQYYSRLHWSDAPLTSAAAVTPQATPRDR